MSTGTEHERVLRLAKSAGIKENTRYIFARFNSPPHECLTQLINLVRAEALEEAAKICDDTHYDWKWDDAPDATSGPRDCAKAIRARKDK